MRPKVIVLDASKEEDSGGSRVSVAVKSGGQWRFGRGNI